MERNKLVSILSLVSAGLSSNDLIPVLSHVWFLEDTIMTYNDHIGVSIPCSSGFIGAVPGSTLINLIKSSKAKDVEFMVEEASEGDTKLVIKAASSRFKLNTLPKDSFVFEMPEPSKSAQVMPDVFYDAIASCLQSTGTDPSVPEQLGVTIIPNDNSLQLYATNNATITYAVVDLKTPLNIKDKVTLSSDFCQQMVALAKSEKSVKLEIHDDYSLLTTPSKASLFGRLIEIERPLDFPYLIKTNCPADARKRAVEIPSKVKMMIERAIIITDTNIERSKTTISVKDGKMRFVSKSPKGEVTDTVLVDGHPDVSLELDCKNLRSVVGLYEKMLVTDRCFILLNKGSIFMAAGGN